MGVIDVFGWHRLGRALAPYIALALVAGLMGWSWSPTTMAQSPVSSSNVGVGVPALEVSLEQVIHHAQEVGALSKIAEAQREVTKAQGVQIGSALRPHFTLELGATEIDQQISIEHRCWTITLPNDEERDFCTPEDPFEIESRSVAATLSLRGALWPSQLVRATRSLESLTVESGGAQFEQTMQELTTQIVDLYYGVLQAEASIDLLELAVRDAKLELEEQEWNVKAASATEADRLDALANLLKYEGQLVQAQGSLQSARIALNQLAGYRLDAHLVLQRPLVTGVAIPNLYDALEAAEERPDIRQARIALEQARANEMITKAQTGPSLQVFGTYQKADLEYTLGIDRHGFGQVSVSGSHTIDSPIDHEDVNSLEPRTEGWAFGVQGAWTPIDGRERSSKLEQAAAQTQMASLHLDLLLTRAQSEVRQADAELKGAAGALEAARKALEAIAEAETNMQEVYRRGAAGERSLVQLQLAKASAEQQVLQAEHAYMKGLFHYLATSGML